jgi:hypothetical protein
MIENKESLLKKRDVASYINVIRKDIIPFIYFHLWEQRKSSRLPVCRRYGIVIFDVCLMQFYLKTCNDVIYIKWAGGWLSSERTTACVRK